MAYGMPCWLLAQITDSRNGKEGALRALYGVFRRWYAAPVPAPAPAIAAMMCHVYCACFCFCLFKGPASHYRICWRLASGCVANEWLRSLSSKLATGYWL
jgi:hypothetical protein